MPVAEHTPVGDTADDAGPTTPVLQLDDVMLAPPKGRTRGGLRDARLHVMAGELVLVRVDRRLPCPLLADGAEGIDGAVVRGTVRFEGQLWTDASPGEVARRRGRIGRVFEHWAWISNLDVMENVLLASAHHERSAMAAHRERAERLARRLGLERLPDGRPAFVAHAELQRAQWVRALLRSPRLVLLERPLHGMAAPDPAPLFDVLDEARAEGAAVVWMTSLDSVWQHSLGRQRVRRLTIDQERLRPEAEAH